MCLVLSTHPSCFVVCCLPCCTLGSCALTLSVGAGFLNACLALLAPSPPPPKSMPTSKCCPFAFAVFAEAKSITEKSTTLLLFVLNSQLPQQSEIHFSLTAFRSAQTLSSRRAPHDIFPNKRKKL